MITLTAKGHFKNTKNPYIAKITGRNEEYTFERTFVGAKEGGLEETTTFMTDEPGLFEICDSNAFGRSSRYVIVLKVSNNLIKFQSNRSDAMTIARKMSQGFELQSMIKPLCANDEAKKIHGIIKYFKEDVFVSGSDPYRSSKIDNEVTLKYPLGDYDIGQIVIRRDVQETVAETIKNWEKELKDLESEKKFHYNSYEILDTPVHEVVIPLAQGVQVGQALVMTPYQACRSFLKALTPKEINKILRDLKKDLVPTKPRKKKA